MSRVELPPGVLAHLDQVMAQSNTGLDAMVAAVRAGVSEEGREVAMIELVNLLTRDSARTIVVAATAVMRLAQQPEGGAS